MARPTLAEFFALARERENLRLRKEWREAKPWTEDPILRDNYFCNVFREDDRTTRWFREQVREPLHYEPAVVWATIVFRWFNYIPTGELIKSILLADGSADELETVLRPLQQRGEKLFTGAFIVKSPNGTDKLSGILDCIRAADAFLNREAGRLTNTLEQAHEALQEIPFLGPFMA